MTKAIDLSGKIFGKLTAVCLGAPIGNRRAYVCVCECGTEKLVRSECLAQGFTKSCGCIRVAIIGALNRSHGMSLRPEYKAWAHAKDRVKNPKNSKFSLYGGRGITMCAEWLNSFDAFYADMGSRPFGKQSIGRVDVDGNYCKENCRWESFYEQARARSDSVYVAVDGVTMILKDACKVRNIDYRRASRKLRDGSWSAKDIFT